MNDVLLYARLKDLGMPADQAWPLTAKIRDTVHPVAAVAAAKIISSIRRPPVTHLGSVQYAEQGASVGGTIGSAIVPGIGTVIGTAVGAVIGLLAHQGQGPQRAAMAAQLDRALSGIPSAYVGRRLPWNDAGGGLQQFLQALMTSGLFMSWDPALVSSPAVNGNWALTFIKAVKAVVAAIINNPVGANVSLALTDRPGGNDARPGNFQFVNPGIGVGPDAIAANVIMGDNGLMYWMVLRTGESVAHAMMNASNAAAEKVFALMVDKTTSELLPASLSVTAANAPIITAPPAIAQAATQIVTQVQAQGRVPILSASPNAPVAATVSAPTTVGTQYLTTEPVQVSYPSQVALTPAQDASAGLMQAMLAAQGANFSSQRATQLLADIAANGVQQTPLGPPPSAMPDWLLPVGLAAGAALLLVVLAR
jgi:hypothetical protein